MNSTEQIKCGHVFVCGNLNFYFNCDLCKNVCRTSEDFILHIRDHFSQKTDVTDDSSSCGSDTEEFFSCTSEIDEENVDSSSPRIDAENFVSCTNEIDN